MSGGTTWLTATAAGAARFMTGWSGFASRGSKYGFLSLLSVAKQSTSLLISTANLYSAANCK